MSLWPWGNGDVKLNLEGERTYKLLQLSTEVCRHCDNFRQDACPLAPNQDDPEYATFSWSKLSVCDSWTPNSIADEALQILTMRKLEGEDIEYIEYISDKERAKRKAKQEMIDIGLIDENGNPI